MSSRTITTTAEQLFPQSELRKSFVVANEDTAINIFLKKESPQTTTVSTTDHDVLLGPGASFAANEQEDGEESVNERWTVVAASGTPRIAIFESERIRR